MPLFHTDKIVSGRLQRQLDGELGESARAGQKAKAKTASPVRVPIALKLAAFFMLPVFIGLSVLTYVMTDSHRDFQLQQIDNFGKLFTEQLAASAREPLFAEASLDMNVLVAQVLDNNQIIGAALLDHRFEQLSGRGFLPEQSLMQNAPAKRLLQPHQLQPAQQTTARAGETAPTMTGNSDDTLAMFVTPVSFRDTIGGYAVVIFEYTTLTRSFEQLARVLIGSTILLVVSSFLIIVAISRRVLEPLDTIKNAISSMSSGDTSYIPERRNDELGQLIRSINAMGKDLAHKSEVQSVLGKFMSADVADRIIQEIDTINFQGEHVDATVLFADIVGFTEMSEKMPPKAMSTLLNQYFAYYGACAKYYFGNVDKYIGDCVMLVFGARDNDSDHRYHALCCALLMQKLTRKLNMDRQSLGLDPVYLRIGINSGNMLAGLLGSQDRMEYTVIGDAVNMASRLCNEAGSGQTIVKDDFYSDISSRFTVETDSKKTIKIRGKSEPASIYNITGIQHRRQGVDDAFIEDLLSKNISELDQ